MFVSNDPEPVAWSGATPVEDLDDFDDEELDVSSAPALMDDDDDHDEDHHDDQHDDHDGDHDEDDHDLNDRDGGIEEVGAERGRRLKHPKLPSWQETVGFIVERNLEQRSQTQGGNNSGSGGFRRRRGPRRRPGR